jgi:hypothetical protein
MAISQVKAADLFSDAGNAKEAALRNEEFNSELNKSIGNSVTDPSAIMAIKSGSATFAQAAGDPVAVLEAAVANKSLTPDALGALNNALASQRMAMQDIQKEISLTSPLSTSFAAFDLEAPAKMLTPRPTPLRNKIARKKGVGTSHRQKQILGYTGTGTGGVGNTWPGITQSSTATFGSINYERGPIISYAAQDLILPYNSYSLSDSVTFDANFSAMGYQDLRQLSSTSTLYATMLMEERMMLMARGTASGYSGALAAPATVTLSSPVAATGQTAIAAATTYYVYVTANAGISSSGFGESIVSTVQSTAVASGDVLGISWTAVTGAIGYNIYVGTSTGTANCTFQGTAQGTSAVIQGAGTVGLTGNNFALTTTGAAASRANADTSAYATGYDGILPTVLGSSSGYNNTINTTFSTSNPGVEYQTVFYNLYNNVKADPDEILINGADRKQLSDSIKNGSTANYRLNLTQTESGDYVGGATIGGLYNEITGKMVPLTVHPWLPQGVSPVLSYTLPIPDTEVSDVWANYMVQDYMGIQWPVTQFSYDFSTYFRGTFFCSAPAWNGAVSGIVNA